MVFTYFSRCFCLCLALGANAACKTNPASDSSALSLPAGQSLRVPGDLPSPTGGNAWGGKDASLWRPEAVYANGLSDFMNRLWQTPNATDVLVSVPVQFIDSGVNPYGDGQSNARITFTSAWSMTSVPMRTGLVRQAGTPAKVVFEFSPDMNLRQTQVEISYLDPTGSVQDVVISATLRADGWLSAEWTSLPQHVGFGQSDDTVPPQTVAAEGFSFFVRPTPGFSDWFPVTFKHPWTTIAAMTATVPATMQTFSAAAGVQFSADLTDPMGFQQKSAAEPIPFDRAYDLGMRRQWPTGFAPQDKPYYPACNVHGTFTKDDSPHDPTAVGRNWTWVADPANQPAGAKSAPFKILYTCFEERRLHSPSGADPDCNAAARRSEEDEGVPSGSGWHKIGDPAETLFNSLERVPILVSAGFQRPSERLGLKPPSGGYAYGLSDVAVARWLWPGEAFLTANSSKDSDGKEAKNFHWFLFNAERETCTVEWVHPKRPDDSETAEF